MSADYIESMRKEWRLRYGASSEISPAQAAEQFALHNFEARVAHLRNIHTPDAMTVRETADRHAFERAIRRTHETLRKVGR